MNRDAMDLMELTEARYELVISVDARRSGEYDDIDKPRMRARIYRVVETAFTHAKVARDAVHMEDRGDGVLLSVSARVPVTRLLGLWMVELHESLRDENRSLRVPLGLRIGMHVGPVRHDERGISGRAVDLACRLADSAPARQLLDAEGADLVLVISGSLYEDVVSGGGKFIEPERYISARLTLKEGETTAWFHLPGRAAPVAPAPAAAPTGGSPRVHTPVDIPPADDSAPDSDTDPGTDSGTRFSAQGDISVHRDNTYQQSVHIGRKGGGA